MTATRTTALGDAKMHKLRSSPAPDAFIWAWLVSRANFLNPRHRFQVGNVQAAGELRHRGDTPLTSMLRQARKNAESNAINMGLRLQLLTQVDKLRGLSPLTLICRQLRCVPFSLVYDSRTGNSNHYSSQFGERQWLIGQIAILTVGREESRVPRFTPRQVSSYSRAVKQCSHGLVWHQ